MPVAYRSFCGWKRSAFGDNRMYGPDSVNFFTRRKTVTQRWPAGGVRETAEVTFPSNCYGAVKLEAQTALHGDIVQSCF